MTALLEVQGLGVCFEGEIAALRGVSFRLQRGEALAVVGETGSGKTTLGLCLAGMIQPPEATGSVCLDGQELIGADEAALRAVRWSKVAIALQGTPFNPVATIGSQIAEPLRDHLGMAPAKARDRALELADEVQLDSRLLDRHPHQLSGGQKRRAALAMVLALDPALVVLDEPTAGLDPVGSRQIVDRIGALANKRGFATVVISHQLPAVAGLAAQTMVLYAGEAMTVGPTHRVIKDPTHPYTAALIGAYPVMTTTKDLRPIRGRPPDPRAVPSGCPFHPRCPQAEQECVEEHPDLRESQGRLVACHFGGLKALLAGIGLHKTFSTSHGEVAALRDVSLLLREGGSVGVIGPSGSGKSTLARLLSGHLEPDAGKVLLQDEPLQAGSWRHEARQLRRRIQLVMQDPADALSPRLTVQELVREPLDQDTTTDLAQRNAAAAEALDSVGLPTDGPFLRTRSHQLSGGQLQRIALARALAAAPKVLVADEPTSMLDASEQARLLVTLRERQVEMGLGLVLVSHDIAIVRKVTDHIIVLADGEVAEEGPSNRVSAVPGSCTGRELVEAAPAWTPDQTGSQTHASNRQPTDPVEIATEGKQDGHQ